MFTMVTLIAGSHTLEGPDFLFHPSAFTLRILDTDRTFSRWSHYSLEP